MSIVQDDTELEIEDVLDKSDLVHVCGGLVAIDAVSQTVRFVHYTVQEYLETNPEIPYGAPVHAMMAKICLTYLSFSEFDKELPIRKICRPPMTLQYYLPGLWRNDALYYYAAMNWGYHTKLSHEEDSVSDTVCRFSTTGQRMKSAIQTYFHARDQYERSPRVANIFSVAAGVGLPRLILALIQLGTLAVGSGDSVERSVLSIAAENGYLDIVGLLVDRADVQADGGDRDRRTPLSYAAQKGHVAVVKLLVGRGDVQADGRDRFGRAPLLYAAANGHFEVVGLLVDRNDVQADGSSSDESPLLFAARGGHVTVVELLVGRDDVQANGSDGRYSPISDAAREGRIAVVELLIGRNDVNAGCRDRNGRTPLRHTASGGHLTVVKLLLSRNDVLADSSDSHGITPLSCAAWGGHVTVVGYCWAETMYWQTRGPTTDHTPLSSGKRWTCRCGETARGQRRCTGRPKGRARPNSALICHSGSNAEGGGGGGGLEY